MSTLIHGYIQTLIFSAVFCFLALVLTPDGNGKKAVGIACVAVMMIATISPIKSIDLSDYSRTVFEYKTMAQEYANSGKANSENLNRLYIQEQCQAYILDKAENLGAEVQEAKVTAEWSNDGFWYPVSCEVRYSSSDKKRKELEVYIEAELGISNENQEWYRTNE